MTVAFAFFLAELLLTMIANRRFYADLFFWLDVVATLSIIPDVPWLMELFVPGGDANETIRAGGRVARVGARAARMVRVMRLLRLLRIFKLLRFLRKKSDDSGGKAREATAEDALSSDVVPTTLASDISGTVSRRVVIILLFVLICANVFGAMTFDDAPELAYNILRDSNNSAADDEAAARMILAAKRNLIFLEKDGSELYSSPGDEFAVAKDRVDVDLRKNELMKIQFSEQGQGFSDVELWLDESDNTRGEAAGTLMLLICLVIILLSSNYVLSNDAIKIVGEPLERVARAQQATQAIMSAFKKISREGVHFDEVSHVMVATAHKVLDAEIVNLFLLDDVQGELWATHTPEDSSPYSDDLRIAKGVGLVGKACVSLETVNSIFENPSDVPSDDISLNAGFVPRDAVCVAIIKGDRPVGVLQVINKIVKAKPSSRRKRMHKAEAREGFSRLDALMLEAFATQIAPVIARRSMDVAMANAMSRDDASGTTGSLLAAFTSHSERSTHSERAGPQKGRLKATASVVKTLVKHDLHSMLSSTPEQSIAQEVGLDLPSLDELRKWGHGCLDYTREQLVGCSMMMLLDVGSAEVGIDQAKATAYMGEIYSRYNRVPYHNIYHAFNVMQSTFTILTTTEKGRQFTAEDKVASLIAACGHDAGHDGVNTAFHVAVDSELTCHYNDRSPLENMHAWHTFDAMRARDGRCDLLGGIDAELRKTFRRQIIDTIIATDMVFHKEKVDKFTAKESIDMNSQTERDFFMEVVVHTADIGHSTYPWEEECRWARLVATEFQAQVDRERAAGVPPTTYMECTGPAHLGKGQVGFINFIVKPLYMQMAEKVPEMQPALDNAITNRDAWGEVGEEKRPMLGNEDGADDDLLSWSANVGCLALGERKAMKDATPTTVLMSDASKTKTWDLATAGGQRLGGAPAAGAIQPPPLPKGQQP